MRVSQLTGRRTNSLGWAKSDCHTCASHNRYCDRRRPRCSPCLAEGAVCKGYVQELNWERGAVRISKKRAKSYLGSTESATTKTAPLPTPATFTFVDPSESQKRPRRRSRTTAKSSHSNFSGSSPADIVATESAHEDASILSTSPCSNWSVSMPSSPRLSVDSQEIEPVLCARIGHQPGDVGYALAFFHSCFAYTTLTFDVNVNPWRACLPSIHEDLPCVRYAAVALAQRQQAHFSGKPEGVSILNLKAKALSLFASNLNHLSFECGLSTALLLIALDYAETGVSNWTVHLRGACHILESHGGIRLAESRPNLRVQIAMLIWYDVNAALISRCGPVFPRTYLNALMAWQADDEWSILALNGLPDGLFLDMYDVAVAASQLDNLDSCTVEALRAKFLKAQIKEGAGKCQILMSQVWRLGLVLYCTRVFSRTSTPSSEALQAIKDEEGLDTGSVLDDSTDTQLEAHALATQILDLVSTIPADSNFQKQCLMPIILAGCEMSATDTAYRKVAIEFSERWKQKTGIWIFDSGLEFLRTVWTRNDVEFADGAEDGCRGMQVPWTEVFLPSAGHGFLFG
ncbi:hypothetical protein A1O7_04752 [Cladophialophora yegresii CBS 114405]|uniref:Zn(2)-C6 fungal-type domain-containing protein n=1 Tax=Cladophialophora yegresii CBS 114405 TaxID=1182544 RepID=W9WQD0_9EURO|nr:uncharacterized protein A1O7_04752 [Cladophialophora yegresii CBS 114405]EXJ60599.1 hypothetical protein A1O7_04752 [Cladophialophora yegresii CBS 114405]